MCIVLVASLSFKVVTQHLRNKAFPLLLMFFSLKLFWSCGFNSPLSSKQGPWLLQLLNNGLQHCLLKGPVIVWRVSSVLKTSENVLSMTPFTFSIHMHLYFPFQHVLRVLGVKYRFFYFVIVIVCLFLYRQACRYLLIYGCCFVFFVCFFLLLELLCLKLLVFLWHLF